MKATELLSQTAEENESLNHWDTFFSKRTIIATYLSSQLTLKVFAKAWYLNQHIQAAIINRSGE